MEKQYKHNPNIARINFVLIAAALILSISEFQSGNTRPLIGIIILVLFWTYTVIWELRTPYVILSADRIRINNFFFTPSRNLMFSDIKEIEDRASMGFIIRMKNKKFYLIDLKKMEKVQRQEFIFEMRRINL